MIKRSNAKVTTFIYNVTEHYVIFVQKECDLTFCIFAACLTVWNVREY
jgi:hypothetical protein